MRQYAQDGIGKRNYNIFGATTSSSLQNVGQHKHESIKEKDGAMYCNVQQKKIERISTCRRACTITLRLLTPLKKLLMKRKPSEIGYSELSTFIDEHIAARLQKGAYPSRISSPIPP
jgi:hypothetical protein